MMVALSPGMDTIAIGDSEASFYSLYHREAEVVLRFLRASVGDLATAEDLCADTFCRAWDRWRSFSGDDRAARAWVFRIARNRLIDHLRHGVRLRLVTAEDDDHPMPGHEEATATRLDLEAAMATLGTAERELLGMRLAGLTLGEIAGVQGRNEEAVKKTWQRALVKVRDRLEVTE